MSRHELVNAYITGTINRRAFVRGLTALGVSAGVAASYAVALQPSAAAFGDGDYYDDYYSTGTGMSADSDGDGLYDADETGVYGTNPYVFDTDGDGTGDGAEVYYGSDPRNAGGGTGSAGVDSDGDGLYDTDETQVYGTNPYVFDTDGDGVGDGQEVYNGTTP